MTNEKKTSEDLSEAEFIEYVEAQSKAEMPCFSDGDVARFRGLIEAAGGRKVAAPDVFEAPGRKAIMIQGYSFMPYKAIKEAIEAVQKARIPKRAGLDV